MKRIWCQSQAKSKTLEKRVAHLDTLKDVKKHLKDAKDATKALRGLVDERNKQLERCQIGTSWNTRM